MSATARKVNNRSAGGGAVPPDCDVAIIGVGPYGLAVQAALRPSAINVRLFGRPMSFWRERMHLGMLIRSPWSATNFAEPGSGLSLDDFERSCGRALPRRLPLADFVAYGDWFRSRRVPLRAALEQP